MNMPSTTEHWDNIFAAKEDMELGWYEEDVSQTLKFLGEIPNLAHATVFLPGAGTSVLVDVLLSRVAHIVANDISGEALRKLGDRVADAEKFTLYHGDVSQPIPSDLPEIDLWIDRAVLHFLLEEVQIDGYFGNLRAKVNAGGHVLLAEFAPDGAPKCAGLELHRYSAEEMAARLGSDFSLVKQEQYTFINPFGDPRPYTYALFKRESK